MIKRPETAKPARKREPRPKPPRTGSAVIPPPARVTVTRTIGAWTETFTGAIEDLRALGVVPSREGRQ